MVTGSNRCLPPYHKSMKDKTEHANTIRGGGNIKKYAYKHLSRGNYGKCFIAHTTYRNSRLKHLASHTGVIKHHANFKMLHILPPNSQTMYIDAT
jgi:hypothetical protein